MKPQSFEIDFYNSSYIVLQIDRGFICKLLVEFSKYVSPPRLGKIFRFVVREKLLTRHREIITKKLPPSPLPAENGKYVIWYINLVYPSVFTQPSFTCTNSTLETPKQCVKSILS